MKKQEYKQLLISIRGIFPNFRGDEDLLNYKYEEVKANFLKHNSNEEITYDDLVEGLRYENEKEAIMQCDLCGEKIPYTTWEDFEKHHRKCEKIDFIDRQCKAIHGKGITKEKYRAMSDEELEKNYRPYMNNWVKTHQDIAMQPEKVFKTI